MSGALHKKLIYPLFFYFDKGHPVRSIEFQKFIDLVTFDQSLVKIEHDIKKIQEVGKSLLDDIKRLDADFIDVKDAKDQARKAVDEKELYMKVLESKELELKDKMNSLSNQKEYRSLQKELESLNEKRLYHEQDLLALWNKHDLMQKSYELKSTSHEELLGKLGQEIAENQTQISQLTTQLDEILAQRDLKQQPVPQEWLEMYNNMKGRVANPVVPVVGDACDACFYSVTTRDLQALRQNKLVQCRDCYRLLYTQ